MKVTPQVPRQLLAKVADINSWIATPHKAYVEAYWHEGEMGDEWKFRLMNNKHEVIVQSLCAATADGHTYAMFLIGMEKQNQISFAEGLKSAAATVYENVCKGLGIRPEPIQYVKKGQ